MKIIFTPDAFDDFAYWVRCNDRRRLKRIVDLVEAIARDPKEGIGKPEPLRGDLSGFWSRRIDDGHRIVYTFDDTTVSIVACRGHYSR